MYKINSITVKQKANTETRVVVKGGTGTMGYPNGIPYGIPCFLATQCH